VTAATGPRPGRDQGGFVTVWTVALSFTCIVLVGLVHDAGRALRSQSDAFGLAAAAARAGAQELDRPAAVVGTTRLDADAARQTARQYLAERGVAGTVEVLDGGLDVTVTVTRTTDLQILPGAVTVNASATAHAAQGPEPS